MNLPAFACPDFIAMRLILAPMQGVLDYNMRDLLTRMGGYDRCVTEFVRVTNQTLPRRVFLRACPELLTAGRTAAGTPVYVQLLGGNPSAMAANAQVAERVGAIGIDLNFGCPSKTVNNSDGGSILLREPQRVHAIVKAVREAVSSTIPVTAKIRLGFYDSSLFADIALGIQEAGATELCVHARTKQQGYQPPAYWAEIGRIKPYLQIPVIANGEIWSAKDARQAQAQSGCSDLMLARGALNFPDLALAIKADQSGQAYTPLTWTQLLPWVVEYAEKLAQHSPNAYDASFLKQWFGYLRGQYPEAAELFPYLKRMKLLNEIQAYIIQSASPPPNNF